MKKARDYERLEDAGLPVPIYGVFDSRRLSDPSEDGRLTSVMEKILTEGSGYAGVRTEPKGEVSPLGRYPHIMPIDSLQGVREAMNRVLAAHPDRTWWFLVNEAFLDYRWNAVVQIPSESNVRGRYELIGEVNTHDNLPLREALSESQNNLDVTDWSGPAKAELWNLIWKAGVLGEWLEVSSVPQETHDRIVFWGMR